MVAIAEYDNNLKAKRTQEGMKAAIAAGKWTHRAPLGYLNGPRAPEVTFRALFKIRSARH